MFLVKPKMRLSHDNLWSLVEMSGFSPLSRHSAVQEVHPHVQFKMHVIASFLYILMWKVLWMEIRIVLVWFPYYKSVKNKWKDRQIDIRLQLLMHNKIWKNVFPCIVWMWVYFSLYLVVNGYRWPTLGSLELEQSCAGSPLVTDVRRCPGRPHLSPSRSPSSPRLLSAHYGSVCSMSSPGLTCRWSHHCWNLAENGREGDDWLIDWLIIQTVKHLFW